MLNWGVSNSTTMQIFHCFYNLICILKKRVFISSFVHSIFADITYPCTRPLFCSCWSRMFSSFRGLGMKPISHPSFTSRPIHQSLLNFCTQLHTKVQKLNKKKENHWLIVTYFKYLFYVQEIFGIKRDGSGRDWNILIQGTTVADIGPDSKCHWFGLKESNICTMYIFRGAHVANFKVLHISVPWLSLVEWRPAAPSPGDSVLVLGFGLGFGSEPEPGVLAPPPKRHLSQMVG